MALEWLELYLIGKSSSILVNLLDQFIEWHFSGSVEVNW